jgi:putative peptidoglycan lipid II flippase
VSLIPGSTRLSFQLSAITALQVVLSFAVQSYVVTAYGAGFKTDALYTGWTIPQVLTAILIDTLSVVLIPALSKFRGDDVQRHGWTLILIMGIGFLSLSGLLFLLMPYIIPVIVPGFSVAAKQLAVSLSRIQIFGVVGTGCYAILSALCQVRNKFVWPALTILLAAGANLAFVVWALPRFGITSAAWGQVIFSTLPPLLLLPELGRLRFVRLRLATVRHGLEQVRPLALLKAYSMTSMPFDRFLASFLVPGSVVIFELVWRFYSAAIRVLSKGVLTPLFPQLSRLAHEDNWEEFSTVYRRQSRIMLGVSLLLLAAVFVIGVGTLVAIPAEPVRRLVGSLTSQDLSRISVVILCMSGMLPFIGLSGSQVNAYYAIRNTRTPARIGFVIYTIGILLRVVGFFAGGLAGMAIAVSCWAGLNYVAMEIALRKQWAVHKKRVGTPEFLIPERHKEQKPRPVGLMDNLY